MLWYEGFIKTRICVFCECVLILPSWKTLFSKDVFSWSTVLINQKLVNGSQANQTSVWTQGFTLGLQMIPSWPKSYVIVKLSYKVF